MSVVLVVALLSMVAISSPIIPAGNAYSALRYGGPNAYSGGFAIEPKQYGGAIKSVASPNKGFIGKAYAVDTNDCYQCAYDGRTIGYSADEEGAARKACDELGGVLTYLHEGSCSSAELIAR